ncbi:hypothetical protein Tco_0367767 [Tanacetum coccineum]
MGDNNASSSGTLPSNTITNPRCEARAITTRSGLSYTPVPPIPPPLYDVNEPLTEKETEVTKDKVLPSTKDIQPPVIQKSHGSDKPVSSPISPEPSSAQIPETWDPGQFLIPCDFSELKCKALADLGASINLMPFSVYTKLGLLNCARPPPGNENLRISQNALSVFLREFARDKLDNEILIPIPKESKIGKDCDFPLCDDFQSFKTFSNPLFEKQDDFPSRDDESILKEEVHKETFKSHLNPLFEKDEEIISNEASRQISPKVDVKTIVSFFSQIGNCVRKWATSEFVKNNDEINHEVFKSENENVLGVHVNEEEKIAFLDGLLDDENFFEKNDEKVEFFERKAREDFERMNVDSNKTKDFDKSSSNVFKSLSDELEPERCFEDKSSKELAPSKALLTLDVFDPLHPPLMESHVPKAFSGSLSVHDIYF